MTRSFSKSTSHGSLKLVALCVAITLGWIVNGAPGSAKADAVMATSDITLIMAHIC